MTVDNVLWLYISYKYYEIVFILPTYDPLNNISHSFLKRTFTNWQSLKLFTYYLYPSIFSGNDGVEGTIYSGRPRELNKTVNSTALLSLFSWL